MKASPNLDVLRAIAVLLVVASHIGFNLGWGGSSYDIEAVGRVGVAIFFVHTSLVLMQSLQRTGAAPLSFYVRRAFRIYPLAVVMVLLVAVGNWLGGIPFTGWGIVSNLLLVQNLTGHESILAPMWSLPYEVQMYLVLPALFLLARSHGARGVGMLLVGSIATVQVLWDFGVPATLVLYVPCFVCGVLAFAIPRRPILHPALLFAVVATAAIVAPAAIASGIQEVPVLWALCVVMGVTIPHCREIEFQPLARAGAFVAKYSYGIYLTHLFAIRAGFRLAPGIPAWLEWVIFVAVLAAFVRVAYRWIEAPGIALGVRLAVRLRANEHLRPDGAARSSDTGKPQATGFLKDAPRVR
jgi:peptidoglycan/LPS O-acetylase OafA/YrhL